MSRQTSTPIPEAVRGGQAAPPGVASSDLLRFQRLFDRTIGLGFKLVIWETPTAGDRASVLAWLASCSATNSARLIEVDLGRLLGRSGNVARRSLNVWSALTSAVPPEDVGDHRAVLVLSGFEELLTDGAPDRPHLLQQFNIQRDILVRDYPCWWLLLTHPAWRQQWRTVAPDFCDFVALWIESPWPAAEAGADRTARMDTSQERPASEEGLAPADWPAALRAAHAAIRASRLDMALDRIYSFRVAATSPQRTERALAVADLLEGDILNLRGNSGEALRRWRDRALPVFQRLELAQEQGMALDRIGDALFQRGDTAEARRLYLKSLAIAERLAQAEPERADYQRDLVVSYWRLGTEDEPAAERHLRRALGILMSLKESGRLDPVDEPWIPRLREFLRQRGFSDA